MDALREFLFEHQGHPLIFDDDCGVRFESSEEIEP